MTLILVAEKGINKLWCNVVAVPDTVDVLPVHQETVQSSGTPPPATTVHSCSTVHTTNRDRISCRLIEKSIIVSYFHWPAFY